MNSAQTALDLLVLTILGRAIQELSEEAPRIEEGSLYPALHRMDEAGWIAAEWMVTENKRRARIYQMTRAGNKQLVAETHRWNSFSNGVAGVPRHA
jgi:PadR family transcriptional regulator PadR